jgi:hypothetical protein
VEAYNRYYGAGAYARAYEHGDGYYDYPYAHAYEPAAAPVYPASAAQSAAEAFPAHEHEPPSPPRAPRSYDRHRARSDPYPRRFEAQRPNGRPTSMAAGAGVTRTARPLRPQ